MLFRSLEEAVHQNNKLTHAAELKDDKIQSLEKRCVGDKKMSTLEILRGEFLKDTHAGVHQQFGIF